MTLGGSEFSRPLGSVVKLGTQAADALRFLNKKVLLTGEEEILLTENGRLLALDCLRLLVRVCRVVDVSIPNTLSSLSDELKAVATEIEFTEPVRFLVDSADHTSYDAILNVGVVGRAELPWTVVNSNGWCARVSSTGTPLSGQCGQTNAIGAMAAASLGVSDIFKRLIGLKDERGALFDGLAFSCYESSAGVDDPGPNLPEVLDIPLTALIGQGAIGNGIVLVLSQLPLRGKIYLLDPQEYGPENLGTCVLLGPLGVDRSLKVDWNAEFLKRTGSRLSAKPIPRKVEDAHADLDPLPAIVVNGLDQIPARHAAQDLWPDALFDGAIGDFSCQFFAHVWGDEFACAKCIFVVPDAPDPAIKESRESGLSVERIRDPDSVVGLKDVEAAPLEKREFLRERVGKTVCSVASEAVLQAISQQGTGNLGSASVPFVATMSSAMVAGALVRWTLDGTTGCHRFYFDLLQGPQRGEHFNEHPRPGCMCVARKDAIVRARSRRHAR
jgi:hypothetical protein